MITLLIARHGNTFDSGDTLLRVGKQTDLPLSNSGREQAKKLGVFLNEKYSKIDRVIVSQLQRTQQTAAIALPNSKFEINSFLDEVDYGIDDGKPESEVIERIGVEALKQWEENAVPPPGWKVDPEKIIQDWQDFAKQCLEQYPLGATILVVTSNGIARFAPFIAGACRGDWQSPCARPGLTSSLKMKTGAISGFQFIEKQGWQLEYWNYLP